MSIHKSLKSYPFKNKHRSVRKRYERVADLLKSNLQKSVFGLPKEKRLKRKDKKEKEEKKVESTLPILSTEKKKIKKTSKDVGKIK